jgi:hypothetical protein
MVPSLVHRLLETGQRALRAAPIERLERPDMAIAVALAAIEPNPAACCAALPAHAVMIDGVSEGSVSQSAAAGAHLARLTAIRARAPAAVALVHQIDVRSLTAFAWLRAPVGEDV